MTIKQAADQNKSPFRAFLPAIGLVMAVALGFISWYAAGDPPGVASTPDGPREGLIRYAAANLDGFSGDELEPDVMRIVFTFMIFLILGSISATLVAFAIPKPKYRVKTGDLVKDKKQMLKDKEAMKKRRRKLKAQMKRDNENR